MYEKNTKTGFPSLITLFSAPNYCTQYNNKAAIMRYENNAMTIKQFTDSVHPYYLPSFMNVFEWSLPFVAEKVGEVLLTFLKLVNDKEVEEEERLHAEKQQQLTERRETIRAKVLAVSKVLIMFQNMRAERERVMAFNGLTGSRSRLHPDLHDSSKWQKISEMKKKHGSSSGSLEKFQFIKSLDIANEARPKDGLDEVLKSASDPSLRGSLKRQASKGRILEMKKNRASSPPGLMSSQGDENAPLPAIHQGDDELITK